MGLIYLARNTINGKGYVGKTTKTLQYRKESHENDARTRSNVYFHKALRLYGIKSFEWVILYQDDDNDKEWMDWWERRFIKKLKTKKPGGYNLSDGGEGGLGFKHAAETRKLMSELNIKRLGSVGFFSGKRHSPESRLKMSLSQRGRRHTELTKAKISSSHMGIGHSEETKMLISRKTRGIKRAPFTEQHRMRMSEAAKKREQKKRTLKDMTDGHC